MAHKTISQKAEEEAAEATNVTPIKKPPKYADESKEDAFKRIARGRFVKAVTRIRSLNYLTNRGSYAFDEKQIDTLIGHLRAEVDALETSFQAALRKGKSEVKIGL